MQADPVEPFSDNWSYLRAELAWLDRLLSLAIARQRKDTKEVDRVARSRADRVTSHWWKGLISLEGEAAYDSPAIVPARKPATPKSSYQQQLEAKVQASQRQDVRLGLPSLCARLKLTLFEKNLVLMALAPEISRRYGRIYSYLQDPEHAGSNGLPTVDLLLRILCHTEAEWRSSRQSLTANSPLLKYQLLEMLPSQSGPLLTRSVKLSDSLVNYLLAEQPDATELEALLRLPQIRSAECLPLRSSLLTLWTPPPADEMAEGESIWSTLILPAPLLSALQHLCRRIQFAYHVDRTWGFQQATTALTPAILGAVVLLVGGAGTGKAAAAQTIAQILQTPLYHADLSRLQPEDSSQLLQEIVDETPEILLLKSAHLWFGRSPYLSDSQLHQLLDQRQHKNTLTLLAVQQEPLIKVQWRQQMSQILDFPRPDEASRVALWKQAFPESAPLDPEIDWQTLARQYRVTGGEMRAIVREAALFAAADGPNPVIRLSHLTQACQQFTAKRIGQRPSAKR